MSTMQASTASGSSSQQRISSDRGCRSLKPTQDIVDYVRDYARQKPDVAALWCLGLGIVVGWKIKPW
ncbi:MAG: hypothetical protein R3C59_27765 [Planctomycetaceae bacterium]